RVCIVGGGSSGILAARQMLDEGFQPVIYELSSSLGGLWAYRGDSEEGLPSVMWSTIINTSKEMSAFRSRPAIVPYINSISHNLKNVANRFDTCYMFSAFSEMSQLCRRAADGETRGNKFGVKYRNGYVEYAVAVVYRIPLICVQTNVWVGNFPMFPTHSEIKDSIAHTHEMRQIRNPGDVRGHKCLESTTVENKNNCGLQVYLSTRRGSWVSRRVGPNGKPIDFALSTRANMLKGRLLPLSIALDRREAMWNRNFNHDAYGLRPKHRINAQHLTVNDALPSLIVSGLLGIKKTIAEFTEDGVLFDGDEEVTKLDDVVLATGYRFKFPVLSEDVMPPVVDNEVQLYKYVFPPGLKHPTLAVIALVQPLGAIFPIAEMQV
ncbi:unnamed protein product, partial [Ixodes persulcatus]